MDRFAADGAGLYDGSAELGLSMSKKATKQSRKTAVRKVRQAEQRRLQLVAAFKAKTHDPQQRRMANKMSTEQLWLRLQFQQSQFGLENIARNF